MILPISALFLVKIVVNLFKGDGASMARTGKCLYKRKDGRWEGRYIKSYTENGKAIYGSVYARSYREAKEKLDQVRGRQGLGKAEEPNKAEDTRTEDAAQAVKAEGTSSQFEAVAKSWWESLQPCVKESTSVKYLNMLNSYINPVIGPLQMVSITDERIEAFCADLLSHGGVNKKGLSPKTVMSILAVIRTVLEYANHSGIDVSSDAKSIRIRQNNREMRIMTHNEQEKLCNHICANPTPTNLGILICLLTGLRIGEICALCWEDISPTEQTIYVHQTMQRIQEHDSTDKKTKIIVTTPKSSCSIRTIPLPDDLMKLILSQGIHEHGYFLTGDDKKFLEPRTMENRFKRLLGILDIDSINFHSLRHTFATRCVELGFDIKTLSEILGHASVNITMNRYVHPSMNMKKENMKRITLPFMVK